VSRRGEWVAATLILLLAAALRFSALGAVPPGLAHDEVANWQIARDILAGQHAIYFTAAYGHEPLYQYVQAAAVALLGDHWLGLRWPSAAFGLLGIAAIYALIRRLFDAPVALLTAAWLAVSFWPTFYARVALRAITLPFTAALAAYFLLRATHPPTHPPDHPTNRPSDHPTIRPIDQPTIRPSDHPTIRPSDQWTNWPLAGLFLGLSLYTYMAARVLPVILIAYLTYFLLVCPRPPIPWRRLLVFLLTAAIVSAPLVAWLAAHPGAEYRINEVREPLDRLLAGDPSLVWQNLVANLKFFTFAGDPWPRQNVPGRPVFADPVSAVLFYAGLLVALRRWRDPRYGFLLIGLAGALVPSIVTSDAPSSIRNILATVVTFAFPTLALVEAHRWLKSRTLHRAILHPPFSILHSPFSILHSSILLLPLVLTGFLTIRDYFIRWPQSNVVRFDYQADLTAVAHRLDELPAGTPVTVAGLSVHTMDGPGLDLAARRDVGDVRLCDTRETLVVPAGRDVRLFVPQVVPLDVDLEERLLEWGAVAGTDSRPSFTSYRLPGDAARRRVLQCVETAAALPDGTPVALPVSFDGRLTFLGYEWMRGALAPGGSPTLLTYWRVETPPSAQLTVFVHLLGASDVPVAQHDGLGSPPRGWAAGDLIVQKHVLALPGDLPPGLYKLHLGVYNAPTGPRLSVAGADRLLLPPVEVNAP
jgi:4-amino-4-deoxy-L-arabinose transferase-like glycosyltransferase